MKKKSHTKNYKHWVRPERGNETNVLLKGYTVHKMNKRHTKDYSLFFNTKELTVQQTTKYRQYCNLLKRNEPHFLLILILFTVQF